MIGPGFPALTILGAIRMKWYPNEDVDPWERRIVFNPNAPEWATAHREITEIHQEIDDGALLAVFNPDCQLQEWIESDMWIAVDDAD